MRSLWTPQTRCWHQTLFSGCVRQGPPIRPTRHASEAWHGKRCQEPLVRNTLRAFQANEPRPLFPEWRLSGFLGPSPNAFRWGVLYAGSSCWYVPPIRGTVKVGWSVNVGSRSPGAGGASGCPACWCWAERMGMTQRGQPVAQGRTTTDLVFTRFSCWETRLGRGRKQWLPCAGPAAAGQSPAW